jgi:hypothetical protein
MCAGRSGTVSESSGIARPLVTRRARPVATAGSTGQRPTDSGTYGQAVGQAHVVCGYPSRRLSQGLNEDPHPVRDNPDCQQRRGGQGDRPG